MATHTNLLYFLAVPVYHALSEVGRQKGPRSFPLRQGGRPPSLLCGCRAGNVEEVSFSFSFSFSFISPYKVDNRARMRGGGGVIEEKERGRREISRKGVSRRI